MNPIIGDIFRGGRKRHLPADFDQFHIRRESTSIHFLSARPASFPLPFAWFITTMSASIRRALSKGLKVVPSCSMGITPMRTSGVLLVRMFSARHIEKVSSKFSDLKNVDVSETQRQANLKRQAEMARLRHLGAKTGNVLLRGGKESCIYVQFGLWQLGYWNGIIFLYTSHI